MNFSSRVEIMSIKILSTLCGISLLSGMAFAADAAADFSLASNPNGVWSYGWSSTLGGSFNLDTVTAIVFSDVHQWRGNLSGDGNPSVFKNTSGLAIVSGTVRLEAFQLAMHPGPAGEYSVLRYTATSSGLFNVGAAFIGQDATTTDVHVLKNGATIYSGGITGFGLTASHLSSQTLTSGDTLDVAVGTAGNGFNRDTTGVNFSVQAVPEPMTMTVLALGLAGVLRRRKNA